MQFSHQNSISKPVLKVFTEFQKTHRQFNYNGENRVPPKYNELTRTTIDGPLTHQREHNITYVS